MESNHEKNGGRKSRDTLPLKQPNESEGFYEQREQR